MPKGFVQAQVPPCVADLVTQQAAANPSAIALSAGREVLSYGELDLQANRLANYLRSLGVGRNVAVGLYLERSPALVVAALAILKAGGAYIPLDPVQPLAWLARALSRLRRMVHGRHAPYGPAPEPASAWNAPAPS